MFERGSERERLIDLHCVAFLGTFGWLIREMSSLPYWKSLSEAGLSCRSRNK